MLSINDLRPARGLMLVQPAPRSEMSAGGIYMPEGVKLKDKVRVENGIVLRLGEPHRNPHTGTMFPWPVAEGDTVFYTWTAGTEVKAREGTFLLVLHNEIIAASVC